MGLRHRVPTQAQPKRATHPSWTARCIHVCVYVSRICIHLHTKTDPNTGKKSLPEQGKITSGSLHLCVYMYMYVLHIRVPTFMCVFVYVCIAYMYTSTHHYSHKHTGRESKRHLTRCSMHSCVYVYIHVLHICIHHTFIYTYVYIYAPITDTKIQARRHP